MGVERRVGWLFCRGKRGEGEERVTTHTHTHTHTHKHSCCWISWLTAAAGGTRKWHSPRQTPIGCKVFAVEWKTNQTTPRGFSWNTIWTNEDWRLKWLKFSSHRKQKHCGTAHPLPIAEWLCWFSGGSRQKEAYSSLLQVCSVGNNRFMCVCPLFQTITQIR